MDPVGGGLGLVLEESGAWLRVEWFLGSSKRQEKKRNMCEQGVMSTQAREKSVLRLLPVSLKNDEGVDGGCCAAGLTT